MLGYADGGIDTLTCVEGAVEPVLALAGVTDPKVVHLYLGTLAQA